MKFRKISRILTGISIAVNSIMLETVTAFATTETASKSQTGIENVDFGLGKLLALFFGLVSVGGVLYLGKGLIDFFSALPDRDTGSMKQGGLEALAGLGMASIGGVVAFLGFTW